MLSYRPVDLEKDRDFIMTMHSLGMFENDSASLRIGDLADYRAWWGQTAQSDEFLELLADSLEDERTIAEVWEEDGRLVAFLWVVFSRIAGYEVTVAEVNDLEVLPTHQRVGIGTMLMQHAEQLAREHGADLLRAETGVDNQAYQGLHRKLGLAPYRIRFEKRLNFND
jgi:ribosomal protein S18 acetylase RimI-like enzyme